MSQRKFDREARRRVNRARRRTGLAAGAAGAAALLAPSAASAANIQVDKLGDGTTVAPNCTPGDADDCFLRDAIAAANGNGEDDTITFAADVRGTLTLTEGQLAVSESGTTISGPGASELTIVADTASRVFNLDASTVISGLTLTDGDPEGPGGAVLMNHYDRVELNHSVITGNVASAGGGVAMQGGGFTTAGSLSLTDTVVTDNEATSGPGGGIHSQAGLTLVDSTVSGNTANAQGGGVAQAQPVIQGEGGKYDAPGGPLSITDSTISGNDAGQGGGGLAVDNSRTGSNFDSSGSKYEVSVLGSTVSGNTAGHNGGGIVFAPEIGGPSTITNSTVANNQGATGGGIYAGAENVPVPANRAGGASDRAAAEGGSLDVENTTVASNAASETGGGIALGEDIESPPNTDSRAAGDGDVGLHSTIVGDNTAADDNKDLASVPGSGFDSSFNVLETPSDATVTPEPGKPSITGQDPQLGALAGNGGPTQTKLPAATSPAVDKGEANSLTTDQRKRARTVDLASANASDGTDAGSVEITSQPAGTPPTNPIVPVTPSSTPAVCGRRAISLIRADRRGSKVKLTGLVGESLYGKSVTIQTDPNGARSSAFTRTTTVRASRTGSFSATVPAPARADFATVRYRAVAGGRRSPALKLPQSLTSRSVRSAQGTITVEGRVKKSVLGKRNRVLIRRLVCGRYRTVGSARPDADGNYRITFRATEIRGVSLYRAESRVLRKPGSKVYVTQYARAISIRTTKQTG